MHYAYDKGTFSMSLTIQSLPHDAQQIAGLASRVNDSPSTLGEAFDRFVDSAPPENDDRRTLSRRVKTRWGSEHHCLEDHIVLQAAVQALTSQTELKLQAYRLTTRQWALARELYDLLDVRVVDNHVFL